MVDTEFLRSDELPGRAALGYLFVDGARTNVFHLPVLGSGDGGAYATAADFGAFWEALFAGRIVPMTRVAEMVRPRSDWPEESRRYGLGLHLHRTGDAVWLEGYDAGVSFTSLHDPGSATTWTVMSNWSDGAWPLVRLLNDRVLRTTGRVPEPATRSEPEATAAARTASAEATSCSRSPELSGVASTRSTPARPTTEGIDRHTPESPCAPRAARSPAARGARRSARPRGSARRPGRWRGWSRPCRR